MNIWLIIWLCLAVSLTVFVVWTFLILMRQKKAWSYYAKKRKLRYRSQSLLSGPELSGVIDEHTISAFTSEHMTADARGVRKLTAIEVNLNSAMPIDGGVASNGMVSILKGVQFKHEYFPKHEAWKKSYVASASNKAVLGEYLTDARVEALCKLMEIPNSWVILIFRDDVMLLRIDVADPLHDPKRLDERIKDMMKVAKICELDAGEGARLKSVKVKAVAKNVELEVDEDALNVPIGLELEIDEDVSGDCGNDAGVAEEKDDAPVQDEKNAAEEKPAASSKSKKTSQKSKKNK